MEIQLEWKDFTVTVNGRKTIALRLVLPFSNKIEKHLEWKDYEATVTGRKV